MEYMERRSTSLLIRDVHVKILMSYHFLPTHLAKTLKSDNTSAGEDMEQLELWWQE